MNDVYTVQIDSLNKVTAQLQAENQTLNSTLTQERSKNDNLSSENNRLANKVNLGSILKARDIMTEGLRYKSNGRSVVTNKAKQVMRIHTRFVLSENHVIDNGSVDIYLRVIGPDGNVMATGSDIVPGNSSNLIYTKKQTVDYANADTPVDVELAKGSQFQPGNYKIEIYHSGASIGESKLVLK